MIEKGLDLIEVETLLGRIGTLIVEKGTKTLGNDLKRTKLNT